MHERCCPHHYGGNSLVSGDGNQSVKYVNILSSCSVFCTYFVGRYSGGICVIIKPLKRHSDHLELFSFLFFPFCFSTSVSFSLVTTSRFFFLMATIYPLCTIRADYKQKFLFLIHIRSFTSFPLWTHLFVFVTLT